MKLTPKLTVIFVLFAMALLGSVNLLGYNVGGQMLEGAAVAELESIAGEKEAALSAWFDDKQSDIRSLAEDPSTGEGAFLLRTTPLGSLSVELTQQRLAQEFQLRVSAGEFLSVMLLDARSGNIMVSSNPKESGRPRDLRSYFLSGNLGPDITPVYFSEETKAPAISAAAPVLGEDGQLLAVLVGRANLSELNAIIQRRSGLRQTEDAFLVNTSQQPITQPRFLPDKAILQKGMNTLPVERCLEGKNGNVFANDYSGVPVIAAYRWIPERQICLIVKITQAEAMTQVHSFADISILISLAGLLLASIVAVGLSHTLIRPIRAMQFAAQRYGDGDMTIRLPDTRNDELGLLAKEFNTMAASLAEKENLLRLHSQELEEQVKARTEELQQNQVRFQALIENAPDGIALLGLDGKLRQVTPSTLQILGYTLEDARSQDPSVLTHPDDLPNLLNVLSDLIQNPGKTVRTQYRFLHKDGSWRWLESTISNLIAEPRVEGIVFNYRDMTERVRSEELLRRYELLAANSRDIILFVRVEDGKILDANSAAVNAYGYDYQELLGLTIYDLRADPSRDLTLNQIMQASDHGVLFEAVHRRKNGTTFPVEVSSQGTMIGGVRTLVSILRDITERVQAGETLRQSEDRYRDLVDHIHDLIGTHDLQGNILSINPAATELLGFRVDELLTMNLRDLLVEDVRSELDNYLEAIQTKGHDRGLMRVRTANGAIRLWEYDNTLRADSSSGPIVRAFARDITERKQAEMQLADALGFNERILTSSPIGILTYRYTGECVSANDHAAHMIGSTVENIKKQNFRMLESWKKSGLYELAEKAISSQTLTSADVHHVSTFGMDLWFRAQIVTFKSQGQNLLLITLVDITERKQAEDKLREKERLLSEAQQIGQIGSLSFEISEDRMQFSDESYHLLDVLPEKFQHNSRDFMALVYPSDRPRVASWISDLKAGWQIKELDFRIFRQNGELRYLHCKGAVEFSSSGAPLRFIGTMQDMSERRLAEIQINQQIKRLTALSEIDRAIIAGTENSEALDVIVSVTLSQLQVDAAAILLLDDEQGMLTYGAAQGFGSRSLDELHIRLGESQSGRVAREQRLIRVPDLKEQFRDPLFDVFVGKENFISYIGVPLLVKKQVRGVLEVFHRRSFQPYQEWLDFLTTLAGQAAIAIENASLLGDLQNSNRELYKAYDATIEGWSRAMDLRDKETEGHAQRVTDLTVEIARAMGVSEAKLVHITRGALLHDIGKLGIPDHILFKPGPLTPDEWVLMQRHPELAYEMLSPIQYLKPALPIPYFHHEKWDGSGYPLGLKGQQIPLEARIFAVVDVWDALLSDRPYRKAWTVERVLEHIHLLSGSHFDPDVVDGFMRIVKH